MSRFPLLLLLLLLVPAHGDEPEAGVACVVPKGPPCLTLTELHDLIDGKHCTFEEGACFTFEWDEYGKAIIVEAEIHVTPSCSSPTATAAFEQKGRDYLASLQSIPMDIKVIVEKCAVKGFVDVKVTKTDP